MNRLGRRIRQLCSGRLKRRFASPFAEGRADRIAQHEQAMLDRAGVTLEAVAKTRPGATRSVLIVRHPDHGRCVLKTRFALRSSRAALADHALATMVGEAQPPLFPQVYTAAADYTLEQHIDGTAFRPWMHEAFDPEPVRAFFTQLSQWSAADRHWPSDAHLRPYEIREICESYLRKCLGHLGYFSLAANLRSLSHFTRDGRAIQRQLQSLADASEQVRIPRGVMCGDMGNVNIIVERQTSRLVVIDYEHMGPGHWGFDAAYLIASLEKFGGPGDATRQMRDMALNEAQMGTAERAVFFIAWTDALSAISQAIYDRR